MAQGNFVHNVLHEDAGEPLYHELILNSVIIADMAASPQFDYRYISPSEIGIGAGYTIRLEDDKKNLYKDGVKVVPPVTAESVISNIQQARVGQVASSSIGATISENYGLHMGPDTSFQFYKRITYPSSDEDAIEALANSKQAKKL